MIRYPGSKSKLLDAIIRRFPVDVRLQLFANKRGVDYREPFFGSGAIGLDLLEELPDGSDCWINDKDLWIWAIWFVSSQQKSHLELCRLIDGYKPNRFDFYDFKEQDGSALDPVKMAFRKIALHQMSFGGFGSMAGGPLGGKDGGEKYNERCRWNPQSLIARVRRAFKILTKHKARITCSDFASLFDGATDATFIYCDPPYVEKGPELYKHCFSDADHHRLAAALRATPAKWVLSYDDHPSVRLLYSGFRTIPIEVRYTCAIEKVMRRKNSEILISNEPAAEPAVA